MANNAAVADQPVADQYAAKIFQFPKLSGISARNVEEHLKLYEGYVKFSNYALKQIKELSLHAEKWEYEIAELQRRFAYEHDGMKHHEMFFSQFEGGSAACNPSGAFMQQVQKDFGSFSGLLLRLKSVAMTRGVGWAMLYYCSQTGRLLPQWVDDHRTGLLAGPKLIFALYMW